MAYYDIGDEVIYGPKNINAKVIRSWANDQYLIEFEDKTLIPPQMDVPGSSLRPKPLPFSYGGLYGWAEEQNGSYSDANCRRCGKPWKETIIFGNKYYDCLTCKIKKEDS